MWTAQVTAAGDKKDHVIWPAIVDCSSVVIDLICKAKRLFKHYCFSIFVDFTDAMVLYAIYIKIKYTSIIFQTTISFCGLMFGRAALNDSQTLHLNTCFCS